MKAFKEIVKTHYEAVNTAEVLRKAHLSKRTFYEAVSSKGNPTLSTVTRIIQGIASSTSHVVQRRRAVGY